MSLWKVNIGTFLRACSVINITCVLECIGWDWDVFWLVMDLNRLNPTQYMWIINYIPEDITQHLLWLSILCRENTFVEISCSLWSMQTEPSWRLRAVNLFARSLCRALAWKNHVSNHQPAIACKHCLYCRCIVYRVKFETWSEIERPVEITTTKHGSTIFSMTSSLASRISCSTHG
jgi:hypothetical protein